MAEKVWRVQFQGTLASGALVRNGYHYVERTEVLEDFASADDVASHVSTHLTSAYLDCIANDTHIDILEARECVKWWAPFDEIPEVGAASINDEGNLGVTGDRLPDGITWVISVKSNAATRGGHGWMIGPANTNATYLSSTQKWEGSLLTDINALAALLDDDISWGTLPTHTLNPVVYSETRRRRDDANWFFDVASCKAKDRPSWLRRRTTVP